MENERVESLCGPGHLGAGGLRKDGPGPGAASYFPGKFAGLPALRDEQGSAPFEDGAAMASVGLIGVRVSAHPTSSPPGASYSHMTESFDLHIKDASQ